MSAYYKQKSVLTTVLGFCGTMIFAAILQAAPPQNQTAPSEPGTLLKKDQDAVNSQLLAAAERFEALVEQAFSAKPAQLDSKISEAENAANQVSAMLPAGAQSELSERLAEIRSARTANSRSELALASVEGYKILVSATHRTKVPIAVSLLDYSGFRYNADLNSKPTRWSDMKNAVKFAEQQWTSISDEITDHELRSKFGAALHEMERAATQKNASKALSAVKTVLDLVDKLERYFNHI